MDNHEDYIDETFKSRFEGSKDHSVNPADQWASFQESMIASNAAASGIGTSSGLAGGVSTWAAAASFATLVAVSSIVSGDQGSEALNSAAIEAASIATIELNTETPQRDVATAGIIEFSAAEQSIADQTSDNPIITNSESNASIALSESSSALSASVTPLESRTNRSEPSPSLVINTATDPAMTSAVSQENVAGTISANSRGMLSNMPMLGLDVSESSLAIADVLEPQTKSAQRYTKLAFVELRAGMRLGVGERNTTVPADLFVNPYASVGAGYRVSNNVNIVAGLGYSRRGGNSLERKQEFDISELLGFVGNEYSSIDVSAVSGIQVEQSIVTTRTDWIQLPVSIELKTSERSSAYVGGYAEYMIHANNVVYLVYNETERVSSSWSGINEDKFVGLRRLRGGAMIGGSYTVNSRISVDGRLLLSLSPALKDESGYRVTKEPNRGFDLQFGVSYRI